VFTVARMSPRITRLHLALARGRPHELSVTAVVFGLNGSEDGINT